MNLLNDFIKLVAWMSGLALLEYVIEIWIRSQRYNLYSVLTGLIFFGVVTYITYKAVKTL